MKNPCDKNKYMRDTLSLAKRIDSSTDIVTEQEKTIDTQASVIVSQQETIASQQENIGDIINTNCELTNIISDQQSTINEQTESLKTLQQSYSELANAAEAYNIGKTQLAAAITSKGVETSPTESYPEMAEKVSAIAQESYTIDGGEMYAKQLFGSLETPNYWNLYDILAQLLSDGRLVNYGGILLAEYYKGYDSLTLAGAGSGGAYVVSDLDENGQFKMYTEDVTHIWNDATNGKLNRWAAYCFAGDWHDFEITDTNTSPRSIFIGRKVGTIKYLANARTSNIIIPDGNKLKSLQQNSYTSTWDKKFVIRNIKELPGYKINMSGADSAYLLFDDTLTVSYLNIDLRNVPVWYIKAQEIANTTAYPLIVNSAGNIGYIDVEKITKAIVQSGTNLHFLNLEEANFSIGNGCTIQLSSGQSVSYIYIGYKINDKTRTVNISKTGGVNNEVDVELQEGYCKPLGLYVYSTSGSMNLTEANMYAHILQRLKQDEAGCGDGVTITLGATNLAKLTSAESQQLLASLRGIYGYTFA